MRYQLAAMRGGRCAPRLGVMAWVLAVSLAACGPVQALDVVRSGRTLADLPTRLAPAPTAPATTLRPQETPGALTSRTQDTALQRKTGPQTALREAEVPPQRLEQTRALLVELKAQPTPEQAISIDRPADVLFEFDKAELRPDATASLTKAAYVFNALPSKAVRTVDALRAKVETEGPVSGAAAPAAADEAPADAAPAAEATDVAEGGDAE